MYKKTFHPDGDSNPGSSVLEVDSMNNMTFRHRARPLHLQLQRRGQAYDWVMQCQRCKNSQRNKNMAQCVKLKYFLLLFRIALANYNASFGVFNSAIIGLAASIVVG
jgi:hypothetical protein